MVIASILIVSTLLIVLTPVFAGQWFMKKNFALQGGGTAKPSPDFSLTNPVVKKVKWDSGNPGMHKVVSEGNDLTDLLVALGAKPLPDGARYIFFKKLSVRTPGYNTLTDDWTNVLVVTMGDKVLAKESVLVTADPQKVLVRAANKLFDRFFPAYEKIQAQRQFEDFVAGKVTPQKKNSLPVIGDSAPEWVEDN